MPWRRARWRGRRPRSGRDGEKPSAYVETDATAPLNVYGVSKRDGEVAVLQAGPHFVLRTSWVHAPGGNNFIAKILSLGAKGDEEAGRAKLKELTKSGRYQRDVY